MKKEGTVEVSGVVFLWSVIDGNAPVITVDHPDYGSKSEALTMPPDIEARLIAKELLGEKRGPQSAV